ncbi:MAG: acetolactate decarboxylase, partial [Caldilineaceae bacterium]|nr:acetolactate decarboxylase [Caldilineaceae bacterium]
MAQLSADKKLGSLYLCAPINALVEGIYEENIPLSTIREHGDFGLGTFNDLDGEMVLLDGVFYQVHADGRITIEDDDVLTPFACSTHFVPSCEADLPEPMEYEPFLKFLVNLLPSPNLFYAIRIMAPSRMSRPVRSPSKITIDRWSRWRASR